MFVVEAEQVFVVLFDLVVKIKLNGLRTSFVKFCIGGQRNQDFITETARFHDCFVGVQVGQSSGDIFVHNTLGLVHKYSENC